MLLRTEEAEGADRLVKENSVALLCDLLEHLAVDIWADSQLWVAHLAPHPRLKGFSLEGVLEQVEP